MPEGRNQAPLTGKRHAVILSVVIAVTVGATILVNLFGLSDSERRTANYIIVAVGALAYALWAARSMRRR